MTMILFSPGQWSAVQRGREEGSRKDGKEKKRHRSRSPAAKKFSREKQPRIRRLTAQRSRPGAPSSHQAGNAQEPDRDQQ